jgi:hypothetical protein
MLSAPKASLSPSSSLLWSPYFLPSSNDEQFICTEPFQITQYFSINLHMPFGGPNGSCLQRLRMVTALIDGSTGLHGISFSCGDGVDLLYGRRYVLGTYGDIRHYVEQSILINGACGEYITGCGVSFTKSVNIQQRVICALGVRHARGLITSLPSIPLVSFLCGILGVTVSIIPVSQQYQFSFKRIRVSIGKPGRSRSTCHISGLWIDYWERDSVIVGQWVQEHGTLSLASDESLIEVTTWPTKEIQYTTPSERFGKISGISFTISSGRQVKFLVQPIEENIAMHHRSTLFEELV